MRFEWDDDKNFANIKKHGIDFNDVTDMFKHDMLLNLDLRKNYNEDRWIGIGWLKSLVGLVVYINPASKYRISGLQEILISKNIIVGLVTLSQNNMMQRWGFLVVPTY